MIRILSNAHTARRQGRRPKFPAASLVFPGLSSALDARLHEVHRDQDVGCCTQLAALKSTDQSEFLVLYLVDPADAQLWAKLPRWQRPIRKGDKTDQAIWKFFIMQRLNMEAHANGYPYPLKAQGYQLQQMGGVLYGLKDANRLAAVLSSYGAMLHAGEDVGDTTRPPWQSLSHSTTNGPGGTNPPGP
jgi:hypothetical protein